MSGQRRLLERGNSDQRRAHSDHKLPQSTQDDRLSSRRRVRCTGEEWESTVIAVSENDVLVLC